jgi:hypothetical protein
MLIFRRHVLLELGYPLATESDLLSSKQVNLSLARMLYDLRYDFKHWVKTRTRLNEFWHLKTPPLAPFSKACGVSPKFNKT